MMVGCGGSAPIFVSRWTKAAALAPLPALGVGAACPCDWAPDGVSALGADSAGAESEDVSEGFFAGVSAGASAGVSIVVGAGAGAVTDTLGVAGALMGLAGLIGLTGLVGFVGFVMDLVHVSLTRFHWPQTAWPYGSGQMLCRVKLFCPTKPAWQLSVLASLLTWQVGGFGVQVSPALYQLPWTSCPAAQVVSRCQSSLPLKLAGQARCSVRVEG